MTGCRARIIALLAGSTIAVSVFPASTAAPVVDRVGPWIVERSDAVWAGHADQGLTTVGSALVTRGHDSVPDALEEQGWTHIGDPGAWHGTVLDAYQTGVHRAAKLFTLTTATGRVRYLVHPLERGEEPNNSFATVAPGGHWFVSGEWGTMHRLLVFAFPSDARRSERLHLAATIGLTHAVRDVQGCAFDGARHLLCSTNDPATDLFPSGRQLIDITLGHRLDGGPDTGRPAYVGSLATGFPCGTVTRTGEVEGIDLARAVLRVLVKSPCSSESLLLTMSDSRAARGDPDPHLKWRVAAEQSPVVQLRSEESAA